MKELFTINLSAKALLLLCEYELSNIKILPQENKVLYTAKILDKRFITNYFANNKKESSEEELSDIDSNILDVFHDVVDFLDQLPFENLLIDTEQERLALLARIERLKNS